MTQENPYLVDVKPINPTFSVKLERGQRGGYGWEVKVSGEVISKVLEDLKFIDEELRRQYGRES